MDKELNVLLDNFPNLFKHTGQWMYGWAGTTFLERFDADLDKMVRWSGYIPPQPNIDDIIGMDDPHGYS